jgi:PD-(D/E)XK nuclease superfamily
MHEEERLRPPNFNIFFALGHEYREVSTHSAMLAHLLDPLDSHAQKILFLRRFLDIVKKAAGHQGKHFIIPPPQDGSRWRCRKEVRLPNGLGRADIPLRGPSLLLVIENKIYASDQENQLRQYWEFLSAEAERYHLLPVVVYLTPDGRAPTPQSIGESPALVEKIVSLSYQEDIYELIQSTSEALKAVSVAEVLLQYAALVRRLV